MEYFYSKYTGEELEERLDRIDDIPELLAEMLTGKNYTTPEDALCIVKKYVPTIYENIPIDNNTIYWANTNDGKVLKARIKSSDNTGDDGDTDDGGCLWEKKTDTNGKEYLYSKLPVVTSEGITMYADNGKVDVPSIYDGLPIDHETLFWVEDVNGNKVLKSKSGTIKKVSVSGDGNALSGVVLAEENTALHFSKSYTFATTGDLSRAKEELITEIFKKADKTYVDETFVTFKKDEDIEGIKNFLNGIKINGHDIKQYDGYDDTIYVDANLVVRGGITMFGTNSVDVPSIMDAIATDGVNLKVVDGVLTFVGSSGGGLSEVYWDDVIGRPTLLSSFIDDVGYLQKSGGQMTGNIGYTLERDTTYSIGLPVSGSASFTDFYSFMQSSKTFIGSILNSSSGAWFDLISLRHTNGNGDDGVKYGMYIITKLSENDNLSWNKQINGTWQGERVILDSRNWSQYVTAGDGGNYLPLSGGTMTSGVRLDASANIYLQSTSGNNWNIFDVNGKRAFCVEAGGYVGVGRAYDNGKTYRLAVEGNAYIGGNGVLQKAISGPGTYISLCLSSYYTSANEIWDFELISDYYGANICDKGGLTHGVYFKSGRKGFDNFIFLDADGKPIARLSASNTGMGHHLFGDLLTSGGITMYSDIRKKTKLQDVELTLKQIADAPLIEHYYNSDEKRTTHVGSIAQYWAGLNDWFCKLDGEGYYTMEVQNAALASAISIARELVKYESKTDKEIRLLKDEVKRLKKEIKILKSA